MAAAGNVIIFVCLYALFALTATGLLIFAGRCFLVVFEGTATGNDEVRWPDETHLDWFFRGATLAWLLLVWLAPLGAFLKVASPDIYKDDPLRAALLAGVVLWLFFPLGVLSALSSTSHWVFFRWRVLMGLGKIGPTTLGFYLASLPVIALPLLAWYFALVASPWLIVLAGLLGAAALFVYARLLGRVAWALVGLNPRRRKKKKRFKDECSALPPLPPPAPAAARTRPAEKGAEVYGLGAAEAPPPRHGIRAPELPPDGPEGYDLAEGEEEEKPVFDANLLLKPIQQRVERAQARLHITEPPRSLHRGVWSFPFYETSQTACMRLALCGMFAGAVLRALIANSL